MCKFLKNKSLPLFVALVFLTGCSAVSLPDKKPNSDSIVSDEQLDFDIPESFVIGTLQHGPSEKVQYQKDEITPLPLEYNGGIFTIPYQATVKGMSTNIGFLVFWDGIPVAYDVGEGTPSSYCHTFTQAENEESISFPIRFIPSGKVGETHTITFASIYNPSYKPDMKSSSGYGTYHNMIYCMKSVYLAANPPETSNQSETSAEMKELTVTNEELTHRFLEEDLSALYGMEKLTMENLDETVRFVQRIDDKIISDNYALTDKPVTIEICLCGTDGKKYAVTPYLDHQPICKTQLVTIQKGMVTCLSVSINPADIEESASIYFMAVPLDESDALSVEKSRSILLYKQ